ncbi:diguanylate cyclase [Salinivibrio sp. ES.052]|uniref:sensor domain-containing diguanylate cyclase n=1 Tax=Salinivibrio sp. ES.052 TaxID=1882823 RepID=UPI00092B75B8|nr:diguanylate cyclase [Salinivibrio sp. ES.052]SIO34430.1 diguanylate cyclase with GAF sensor [Salinivibrio sp. ES.052]
MNESTDQYQHIATILPSLFRHLDTAVVIADTERRIQFFNPQAEALFGCGLADVKGASTRILYAEQEDFIATGKDRFNTEAVHTYYDTYVVRYKTANGHVFLGETHGGPVCDEQQVITMYVAFIQDISTRVEVESTLNQLHSITSARNLDFCRRVERILSLGCKHFNLPIGILSQIHGQRYTVQYAQHPDNALHPGQVFDLKKTYCCHVYEANEAQGFHHVAQSNIKTHPCYEQFGLEAYIGAPIFIDGERYGTLNFSSPEPSRPFVSQDYELVRLFAEWVGHELARLRDWEALEQAQQLLEIQANTDSLTQLYNRHYLTNILIKELARCERYKNALTLAIVDFDNFKHLNDSYGHRAGDIALQRFGNIVREESRTNDIYGRWGGEEFLCLLPETNLGGAEVVLQRLVSRVHAEVIHVEGQTIRFTISIGYTRFISGDTQDTIIHRADTALYLAKENGRNRIEKQ